MSNNSTVFLKDHSSLFWRSHHELCQFYSFVSPNYCESNHHYYTSRYSDDTHVDECSVAFLDDSGPFCLFQGVSFRSKENNVPQLNYYEVPSTSIQKPLLTRSQAKYISRELDKLLNFKLSFQYIEQSCSSVSCIGTYLLGKNMIESLDYISVVDLNQPDSVLWTNLRKSYKQLIKIGLDKMKIHIHFGPTITWDVFEQFMNLHIKAAGRVTRGKSSWYAQYLAVKNNHSFYISGSIDNDLVTGALFTLGHNCCYYSVSASKRELFDQPLMHVIIWKAIGFAKQNNIPFFYTAPAYPNSSHIQQLSSKEQNIALFKAGFGGNLERKIVIKNLSI